MAAEDQSFVYLVEGFVLDVFEFGFVYLCICIFVLEVLFEC